jgi:hypothetical protein
MEITQISKSFHDAAAQYGNALKLWYPQHGQNAPAERNLTMQLAVALPQSIVGVHVYAEASLGASADRRVDLVAYEPATKHILVVEAKRFIEKSPGGLLDDIERIRGFEPSNSNHGVPVAVKFGAIITQTIDDGMADQWKSGDFGQNAGPAWAALAAHLATLLASNGVLEAAEVHQWEDNSGQHRRHVLWAIWRT